MTSPHQSATSAPPTPSAKHDQRSTAGSDWRAIRSAPEWGRRVLSKRERRIVLAAVEAMLADGHDHPIAADRAWCERIVDDYDLAVGNSSGLVRGAITGFIRALNWLPAVAIGRPMPLTALPLRDRIRYLDALERHRWAPFTMLLIACKVPMLVPAFDAGEPLASTGFDRPTSASRRKLPVVDEVHS